MLNVVNLSKSYGAVTALEAISFRVRPGDILGVLGPNGAGKTTAIRIIMGILRPQSGHVIFDFPEPNGHKQQRIGYLPEERGLYEDVRVLDNLLYLAQLKQVDRFIAREQAESWLKRFDLWDRAQQRVDQLSKGMQQKVQFIAAVLHAPDLIILDEPFSGLDPLNQDLFKDIIRELQADGRAILLSAHQMEVVEELCDRIFMVHEGRQVLYGNLTDIKANYPEHIVDLRFPRDIDPAHIRKLCNIRITRDEPGRIIFRHDGPKSVNDLLGEVARELPLFEVSVRKPPLQEIFVQTARKRGASVEDAAIV